MSGTCTGATRSSDSGDCELAARNSVERTSTMPKVNSGAGAGVGGLCMQCVRGPSSYAVFLDRTSDFLSKEMNQAESRHDTEVQ